MALIEDRHRTGPQIHALIIGVGAYPYLHDPKYQSFRNKLPADLRNLEPLPSAPLSALELVRWLKSEYDNSSVPLGTIECLLSDPARPAEFTAMSATIDNIQDAFDRWYERCDADIGNTALFYYCGHGFMKTSTALLSEDFGHHPHEPFVDTINFDSMEMGMRGCNASTQLFFADACRQIPRTALQMINDLPSRSLVSSLAGSFKIRRMLRANAAVPNTQAHTRSGQITQFTRALLQSLEGQGSERGPGGQWVVTINGLNNAIHDAVDRLLLIPGTPDQSCEIRTEKGSKHIIHVLPGVPEVPIRIGCRPNEVIGFAVLSLNRVRDATVVKVRVPPQPQPWELTVPADQYLVTASFADNSYPCKSLDIWATPPSVTDNIVFA
ncbi:caspase family protein [Methylobacter marinus]|uniref:caspase family protein n=1 Tax=Methylobacter marinus TaxID=34058 RepID=UPI00036FDAE1|nr:caspase family protein [Methylobacter marinus]